MFPISPTSRLFSLRQSIEFTVPNSFGSFPARPNLPTNGAVEFHLVDLAGDVDVLGRIRIRAIQNLIRPGRDAKRHGRSDVGVLRFESAVVVENLNSLVAAVGRIHVPFRVDGNRRHGTEHAGSGAFRAPRLDEHALAVEFCDARVAHPVGHKDVAGGSPMRRRWAG